MPPLYWIDCGVICSYKIKTIDHGDHGDKNKFDPKIRSRFKTNFLLKYLYRAKLIAIILYWIMVMSVAFWINVCV